MNNFCTKTISHSPDEHGTPPSVAEITAAIDGWSDLTDQRRRDLRSALACTVEIAKPHALELSCACLNELLYRRPPAAWGLAAKHFANIVSALRYILRRLDRHAPGSVAGLDGLSPDWRALMALLPTHERQLGLIRFAKYCSASGIAPERVAQECLESFEAWLLNWTITDEIPGLVRRTASNWRWAAKTITGWPQVQLERASGRDWYSLPLAAYGEGLEDKAEIVALNKIDALTPEARDAAAAELEAACGTKVYRVSGVSGEGVTNLLRAAFNAVQERRAAEGHAPRTDDIDEEPAPEGGWQP